MVYDDNKKIAKAFATIGLNYEEITASITAGTAWADYFDQIIDGINAIEDSILRRQIQVTIFGNSPSEEVL